ncbi:hypothetical protein [Limisalsivibrio acetivorans]|uniref:hypothetical protein n=1 Tax=Limisalsivibrio acetivorans TaxID=1304888 RepID=UPI0003B46190
MRDALSGWEASDIDTVPFGCSYEKFAFFLKKKLKCTAVKFKDNVRLSVNGLIIDVSAPRGENIEEDLALRDFTINNLAYNSSGELIGDRSDLDRGILRRVYDRAFDDDPVRIIRGFRFLAQHGLSLEESTLAMMTEKAELIGDTASERIFEELRKLFYGDNAPEALRGMLAGGLMGELVSEVSKDDVETACAAFELADRAERFDYVSAALFGSQRNGKDIMQGLSYPVRSMKRAVMLAERAKALLKLREDGLDVAKLRRFVYNNRRETAGILNICFSMNGFDETLSSELKNAEEDIKPELADSFGGEELMKLGVERGPLFGEILQDVKEALASGELEGRSKAEGYIRKEYGSRIDETS